MTRVFYYDVPPEGETRFTLTAGDRYYREIWQCQICHHFISLTDLDLSNLYQENYVSSTYGEKGIKETFERIISLPPEQSDNIGRVQCIVDFATQYFPASTFFENFTPRILDVGSGLGVFPYQIARHGWNVTALDPDPRFVAHITDAIGVKAVCGDFLELEENLGEFDIITFNKVLEHVENPVEMLSISRQYLRKRGSVYIELPDAEMAMLEGKDREEFFIEHFHIFSMASISLLATRSGFTPIAIERLQEPSTKYTLRAFLKIDSDL